MNDKLSKINECKWNKHNKYINKRINKQNKKPKKNKKPFRSVILVK